MTTGRLTPAPLIVGGFSLEDRQAVPIGEPTLEGFLEAVSACRFMVANAEMWLGDLLNYGEAAYGEKYSQAIDATGLSYSTLANVASVAKRVPISRRREDLTFGHHEAVAKLEPQQQVDWLEHAAVTGTRRDDLRTQIKSAGTQASNPRVKLWLLVECNDIADQVALRDRMVSEGRIVKLTAE